ncbi:hypothetical protein [Tolypothrix sp. VBCCA 56010]|uniref:hypothetical protein n=1 Tax=Tolypothrix sp. VBCCA 56010 TaxID=3137731 RepID=UPI003D7EBA09
MGNGQWAMGNGQWAMGIKPNFDLSPLGRLPHAPCPMPHAPCPTIHYPLANNY